jgi:L-arabinose transport system substrate-binding protein
VIHQACRSAGTARFRWLVVGFALVALAGCERNASTPAGQSATAPTGKLPASAIKIGCVVKQPEEPWFQNEWTFAQQAADKYGFDLIKIGAVDGEKVLAAIDNLRAQGAQGLVICTPDVRLGPAIVERAAANHLKLFSVDDRFVGPDGKFMTDVHYLGISARNIGRAVGKALYAEMQKRKWPIAEVALCAVTFEELDTAKERTDGAIEALEAAGFPGDKVYKAPTRTPDVPGAFDATNIVLTQHPEVKRWLVCGMNDNAVLGAVRAMEGRGMGADTVIGIGINGTDCIDEFRKPAPTGFFASMLLTPRRHGFETAEMMFKWIRDGVEPPKLTLTEGILITRDTYEKIMKDQGLLK